MRPQGLTGRISEVAVIGPEDSVKDLTALNSEFPGLRLIPHVYETEQEAVERYRSVDPNVRVVLFTGPLPYYAVTRAVEALRPMLYVPFTGVALYRSLFQLYRTHDVTRISIDTVDRISVAQTYADLGLKVDGVKTLEYADAPHRSEFVRFHKTLFERGETEAALTCLRSAHHDLVSAGVPCLRITPTRAVLQETLERAYLMAENIRTGENQIVVGIVDVTALLKQARSTTAYTDVQMLQLNLQGEFLRFVQSMDGHLTLGNGDEFLFHTTQGPFLRATENLRSFGLIDQLKPFGTAPVYAGIGLGYTAAQAGIHAQMALDHARRQGTNACYVVSEDRRVIGPLGSARQAEFAVRTIDGHRLDLARAAGIAPTTLERLISAVRALGLDDFTASDVAPRLQITDRSARRLLRILAEVGIVQMIGEEAAAGRGRPRQVFRLDPSVL